MTRNSSGDEIANINFLRPHRTRITWKYNRLVHKFRHRSKPTTPVYVLVHRFTKFTEITQCNGHYAVQGHSRSPILVTIDSKAHIRLPISEILNLSSILHVPFPSDSCRWLSLFVKFSLARAECLTKPFSHWHECSLRVLAASTRASTRRERSRECSFTLART